MHSETVLNLEKDMASVRAAMENRGLNVNLPMLESFMKDVYVEKLNLESELRELLGVKGEINFNSSNAIAEILIKVLGVEPKVTHSGRYSTNRKVLKGINNPLTEKISKFRDLTKSLSSLTSMHGFINKATGKIFCKYTNDCPSGRLYTKDYNFQSISELGRKTIFPDESCSFVLMDYDSFELRILSALSGDKYFKDCWAKGLDLHRKVISDMKDIAYNAVTDRERKLGKILNFGLAYGQEAMGLARNLGIATNEAQKLMNSYKERIPEIETFKLKAIEKARLTGYTETYYGRRRFLVDIKSPNVSLRKKAERRVINTMIQGTGADIVKFSLVKLHREGFLIDTMLHDGVLLTVFEGEIQQSISRIKEIMEIEINGMRFTVSRKTGKTWAECY